MTIYTSKDSSGLAEGIGSIGSALEQAIEARNIRKAQEMERQRQVGGLGVLMDVLKDYDPSNVGATLDTLQQAIQSSNVDPQMFTGILQNIMSQKMGTAKAQTPFQKEASKKTADIIFKAVEGAEETERSNDTLDEILRLSEENLRGPVGMLKGIVGTESATKMEGLGLSAIEPLLKILNPRGAIPQRKIELILGMLAPKATDLRSTIQGKVEAIRQLNNQAKRHSEKIKALYEKYGEDIPLQELMSVEKSNESLIDSIISGSGTSEMSKSQEMVFDKLPPAKDYSGKTMVDENGNEVISNGKTWKKIG